MVDENIARDRFDMIAQTNTVFVQEEADSCLGSAITIDGE